MKDEFKYYTIDELTTFMVCPFKYWLYKRDDTIFVPNADSRNIIGLAVRDTVIKYYIDTTLGKPFSIAKAAKYFSSRWYVYKNKIIDQELNIGAFTDKLIKAHEKITNIHNLVPSYVEVAAANFKSSLPIGKKNIVTGSVDLIGIDKRVRGKVYAITVDVGPATRMGFSQLVKGLFCRHIISKEFQGRYTDNRVVIPCILNPYNSSLFKLKTEKITARFMKKTCAQVISAIEQKLKYPAGMDITCEMCLYKEQCDWNNPNIINKFYSSI